MSLFEDTATPPRPGTRPYQLLVETAGETPAWMPDVEADSYEGRFWLELQRVGGGSTAWLALVGAMHTATTEDELAPGGAGDTVDWAVAWDLYVRSKTELSAADEHMSHVYDLADLHTCQWCETRDTDDKLLQVEWPQLSDSAPRAYHAACLAEHLREQGL